MNLKIEYVNPSELTEAKGNAKIHTREQIKQIKKSIQEFGFNDPIAVFGENNEVVEGNGRLKSALELGLKEVPIIRLDELTPKQRDAYAIVHNKLTLNTGFDFSELSKELSNIQAEFDMTDFGFSDFEILFESKLGNRYVAEDYANTTGGSGSTEAQMPKKNSPIKAEKEAEKEFIRGWTSGTKNPEPTSIVCEIAVNSEEEAEWLKSVLHVKKLNQVFKCSDLMSNY